MMQNEDSVSELYQAKVLAQMQAERTVWVASPELLRTGVYAEMDEMFPRARIRTPLDEVFAHLSADNSVDLDEPFVEIAKQPENNGFDEVLTVSGRKKIVELEEDDDVIAEADYLKELDDDLADMVRTAWNMFEQLKQFEQIQKWSGWPSII